MRGAVRCQAYDVEESSDNTRKELDYYASMVILGPNYYFLNQLEELAMFNHSVVISVWQIMYPLLTEP